MNKILPLFCLLYLNFMNAQTINLPEIGLDFDIPEGWTGNQYEDYFLLGHKTLPGLIILSQNEAKSAQELKELALKGIVDEGVNLQPKGAFILQSGERVQGEYQGTFQQEKVRAFAIGLINGLGAGINIIVLTSEEKFTSQHIDEALKIAASVKFYEAKDAAATTEWKQWLVGKKLKYLYSNYSADYMGGSTSISDTKIINLYEDGTFSYYFNSHNSFTAGSTTPNTDNDPSGFGYVNGQEENTGTYTIYSDLQGSFLELHFNNDTYKTFELGMNSEKQTTLNGTRYYVTAID